MNPNALEHTPHRRRDPLGDQWVLVSPNRTARPWQGAEESPSSPVLQHHDSDCYLCPGSTRANGAVNPDYADTFVFTNDFAALQPDGGEVPTGGGFRVAQSVRGTCRVLCFSPRHDESMALMHTDKVGSVVDLWASQSEELAATHESVQIFENRGEAMGASSPHPHGQVWAMDRVPSVVATEDRTQLEHFETHGRRMLADYISEESSSERVVVDSNEWIAVVPWWATWPFETLLIPRRGLARLPDLDPAQRAELATVLGELLTRYDNLFEHPFPYSMGWHQAPGRRAAPHWTLHAHFYPPLLRSASVRKFMVGFEMLGEAQRDLTPEQAAERLRDVAPVHYSRRGERP